MNNASRETVGQTFKHSCGRRGWRRKWKRRMWRRSDSLGANAIARERVRANAKERERANQPERMRSMKNGVRA